MPALYGRAIVGSAHHHDVTVAFGREHAEPGRGGRLGSPRALRRSSRIGGKRVDGQSAMLRPETLAKATSAGESEPMPISLPPEPDHAGAAPGEAGGRG